MAENITTILEKWLKQHREHPEWTPSREDIIYMNHGAGSDRDRVFSIGEIFQLGDQLAFLEDPGDGGKALTSQTIIDTNKSGKIPVVVKSGDDLVNDGKRYYFPMWLYYNDDPETQNVNRDATFYAVKHGTNFGDREKEGHVVVETLRYWNTPYQSIGERSESKAVDISIFDGITVNGNVDIKDWRLVANTLGELVFSCPSGVGDSRVSPVTFAKGKLGFNTQVKSLNSDNTIDADGDIDLSESPGGSSVYVGGYALDAPFAIFNTTGVTRTVTYNGSQGNWSIQPNCARWFCRHKVGGNTQLFAF